MAKTVGCDYTKLTRSKALQVTADWLLVEVNGLKKGEFYTVPLFLHAPSDRPIKVEIMKAGSTSTVEKSFEFLIGRGLTVAGKDTWRSKRYKLDKARHNGRAYIRIGWKPDGKPPAKGVPFNILAGTLESKYLKKKQRIDEGLCPTCGEPGEWIAMAMCCSEHGVFLG